MKRAPIFNDTTPIDAAARKRAKDELDDLVSACITLRSHRFGRMLKRAQKMAERERGRAKP